MAKESNIVYLIYIKGKAHRKTEKQWVKWYERHINHKQYPDFDKWLGYMWHNNDVVAVI